MAPHFSAQDAAPGRVPAAPDTLLLKVERAQALTERVTAFTLVPAGPGLLPAWEAGAHIEMAVETAPGVPAHRAYSLVGEDAGGRHYEIAVQREDGGAGGSRWMHGLRPGDLVRARPPANHFALAAQAREHLLLAGGIGITPILSMARALLRQGRSFALHYAARTPEAMPYREQVGALPGATLHFDAGQPGQGMPLPALLARPDPGRHLYVCGPMGLTEATVRTAQQLGWTDDCIHYELFAGALAQSGDTGFEVECAQSGRVFVVPPGKSILDVLTEQGMDPLFDCRNGSCGVCVTPVLQGTPDHRDSTLSAQERARADQLCICVSRAHSPRLVLDI